MLSFGLQLSRLTREFAGQFSDTADTLKGSHPFLAVL